MAKATPEPMRQLWSIAVNVGLPAGIFTTMTWHWKGLGSLANLGTMLPGRH